MSSAVCTLFEGHYHYGVAVLVNSLYKQGYRGAVYAGYRGELPPWCVSAPQQPQLNWPASCTTMHVAEGLDLHFLSLNTDYHLTNYKPDFMLALWDGPAKDASGMFYFDPDIVIAAPWNYFEIWIGCGVAVNEDVNSPMPLNHPRRAAWRDYYRGYNMILNFRDTIYVNGGFAGVTKHDKAFLHIWQDIQEKMAPAIGGLDRSAFKGKTISDSMTGPFAPFGKTDQDALNVAMGAWQGELSLLTKSGMAFSSEGGMALMPHALGQAKPWKLKPIARALSGKAIRVVDKAFWDNADGSIQPFSKTQVAIQRSCMKIAVILNKFYK